MTDQEIQTRMEELYQKQQKCLRIQKWLGIAAIVLFVVGVFPLFANVFVTIFWGGHLANKATWLAKKRYPYVPLGPGYGGIGLAFDPLLITVAAQLGDNTTIEILKFRRTSIWHFGAGFLGYILMWLVVSILKEITGIDFFSMIPLI